MTKKANSTEKANWNDFWDTTSPRFTKISWSKKRICKILARYLKPGMAVLDAGSGSGFFSNYFIENDCKTYSLDYSETALQLTRTMTHDKSEAYLLMDLLDPQFGQAYRNTFDVIFSDGLLEHFAIENQRRIIQNWKLSKKEDGIIVTFVPNKYSPWEIIRPLFMPGIEESPFTLNKLEKIHQEQNINFLEVGGINTIPFPLSPDKYLGKWFGMLLYIIGK